MIKEATDDYNRKQRDKDLNNAKYQLLTHNSMRNGSVIKTIKSQHIKVGQILKLKTNQRVPADLLLIKASEKNGCVFIRTDQLDGETDWKMRKAC
jgi:phospholipid-translocating ATPase